MDDELLIALVRAHPAFYDVSDPGYNDSSYKYKVWVHISTELNVDVSSCKTRWNNLRDNYRKSLKKNAVRFAQAKKTKLYKYADQLSFLDECFEERRAKGMAESPREEEYTNYIEDDEIEEIEEVEKKPEVVESQAEYIESFQYHTKSEENLVKRKLPRRISYAKVPVQTAGRPGPEYRLDEQDNTQSPHPVDAFLAGIAPTMKTFSPYYLNLAKSEIFASVQKFEMRMLEQHLAYGKPGSSYIHDVSIIAPSTSTSQFDSTSRSPRESYDDRV